MQINENIINARLQSHADRINRLEYKMYEDAMNVNIQNHQYVLNLIETQWHAVEKSHTNMYCNYLRRINVTASCHVNTGEATLQEVRPDRCSFAPVIPELYKRYDLILSYIFCINTEKKCKSHIEWNIKNAHETFYDLYL